MKKQKDIIRLAKEGKDLYEIAKLLGYKSTSYVSRVLNKNNQPVRRVDEEDEDWKRGTYGYIWELHGKCHREDGPAHEWADGDRWWYLHGKLHREDGPAREWGRMYYWHGKWLNVKSQEEFEKLKPLLLIQEVQES